MTVTKLSIANGALRLLKERSITQAELTNGSREPARLFNAIWDDGGLDACLQAGQWKFAKRTVELTYSPSVTPPFGYTYAFDKPSDLVRVVGVWQNNTMTEPLLTYREEAGYWFANQDTIWVAYVSNDASYGGDYSLWPQNYLKFVQSHFASEIAGPLTELGKEMRGLRKEYLDDALSTDAMAEPTKFPPVGSWVRARRAGGISTDGQP